MTSLRAIRPTWGRCPQPPGIYRLTARMTRRGGGSFRLRSFRQLSRRSGCVPAVPYPPLRCFQSGRNTTRRAMIFQRTATTPLIRCLTPGVHFKRRPLAPHPHPRFTGLVWVAGRFCSVFLPQSNYKAVGHWVRGVAHCAPHWLIQNCPPAPSAASCSRMYVRTCSSSNPTVDTA